MISLEEVVRKSHQYRKFNEVFSVLLEVLKRCEKNSYYKGYGFMRLFKYLVLQFMEDLSDRELIRYIQEDNAAK